MTSQDAHYTDISKQAAARERRANLFNLAADEWISARQSAKEAFKSTTLPSDSAERKAVPIMSGVLDYFPDAIAEVARLSKIGNDKHNPGEPLNWSRGKSSDHADCLMRHMMERGTLDTDGILHDAKVAWRALAQLQLALERRRA